MNEWRETAKNPPTKKDTGKNELFVLSVYFSERQHKWRIFQESWLLVASLPDAHPFWMPLPDLPKELERVSEETDT